VQVSDVVLYEPGPGASLAGPEGALVRAVGTTTLRGRRQIGLFSEAYGLQANEAATVTITVTPLQERGNPLSRLAASVLRLSGPTPIHLIFPGHAPRSLDAPWGQGVTVNLSTLKPGRYQVTLDLNVPGQHALSVTRTFTTDSTAHG